MRWIFGSVIVLFLFNASSAWSQSIFDRLPGQPPGPAAAQPPAAPSTAPPATEPAASQPATAPAHRVQQPLLPIPDAEALGHANTFVNDHYAIEIKAARTADQKKGIVQKLLAAADSQAGANQFALLARAKSIAIDAVDVAGAIAALEQLESAFIVDSARLRLDAYLPLARSVTSEDDGKLLCDQIAAALPAAILSERFDIAKAQADLTLRIARKFKNAALEKQAAFEERWARMAEETHAALEKSFAMLASKPDDPEANLKVGQYRCFIRADWRGGLPMLKVGSDSTLKTLASQELDNPSSSDAQVALADAWWDYSAKLADVQKSVVQKRAALWYEASYDSLNGVLKLVVQKRIDEGDPGHTTAGQSPKKTTVDTITIEALVEGATELHIIPTGIFWLQHGLDKPGKSNGSDFPTFVNGKEWLPKWGKPAEASGDDTSEPLAMNIGIGEFDYRVVAITPRRGDHGIATRGAVTVEKHIEGDILIIADSQPRSAMWYAIILTRDKSTEHPLRFAGKWMQKVGGVIYTFGADGTVASSLGDNNKGTWGADGEGTAIKVKWDNGGLVDFYTLNPKLGWSRVVLQNGIFQAQHHMTPP